MLFDPLQFISSTEGVFIKEATRTLSDSRPVRSLCSKLNFCLISCIVADGAEVNCFYVILLSNTVRIYRKSCLMCFSAWIQINEEEFYSERTKLSAWIGRKKNLYKYLSFCLIKKKVTLFIIFCVSVTLSVTFQCILHDSWQFFTTLNITCTKSISVQPEVLVMSPI